MQAGTASQLPAHSLRVPALKPVRKQDASGMKKSFVSIQQAVCYRLTRSRLEYKMSMTIQMPSSFTVGRLHAGLRFLKTRRSQSCVIFFAVLICSSAIAQKQPRPRVLGVAHMALYVSDLQAARVFYKDFLR